MNGKTKEGDPSLTLGMTKGGRKEISRYARNDRTEGDPSLTLGMTRKRECHSEPDTSPLSFRACEAGEVRYRYALV
jgi:hypothetical protein